MKRTGFILISLIILFCLPVYVAAQTEQGIVLLKAGITNFQNGNYAEALKPFREIIVNPNLAVHQGDAYFWITKTYISLGQYDNASKNAEFFLSNFRNHTSYHEIYYQKGRILFLQNDYDNALLSFKSFIDTFPSSPFVPNAFFWIGESLYILGHFDEAYKIFSLVIQKYPQSFRVEAAEYRVSLIELKRRENELLQLLRVSHEEYLKLLEEFEKKEKSYEQAIIEYQRKLSSLTAQDLGAQIISLTQEIGQKDGQIEFLKKEIVSLQNQLSQALSAQQTQSEQSRVQAPAVPITADARTAELLRIKAEALVLKEFYLDWLLENLEKNQ